MQSHRPISNQHRLQRLALWALAVLVWIEAILFGGREIEWRHWRQRRDLLTLPGLTHLVGKLLLERARQIARPRRRPFRVWRRGQDLRRAHLLRSALGARFRRALKHKDTRTWIAHLIAVLRNLDAYAAGLARRLRKGLTRLWRTWAAWTAGVLAGAAQHAMESHWRTAGFQPAFTDSS